MTAGTPSPAPCQPTVRAVLGHRRDGQSPAYPCICHDSEQPCRVRLAADVSDDGGDHQGALQPEPGDIHRQDSGIHRAGGVLLHGQQARQHAEDGPYAHRHRMRTALQSLLHCQHCHAGTHRQDDRHVSVPAAREHHQPARIASYQHSC